jgi:hypothetical protein
MNARIMTAAAVTAFFCGVLPGRAADPAMLNLLMPDAKIVAGVNVQTAVASPFGLYVLSLLSPQDQQIQQIASLVGFDPRKDVTELLVGAPGTVAAAKTSALVLARGHFALSTLSAAAQIKGATAQVYKGVTILGDPQQIAGVAFLDADAGLTSATLMALGPMAQVRAAVDRLTAPSILDIKLLTQVQNLSAAQDAWAVSMAPLASLLPLAGAQQVPGAAAAGAVQIPGMPPVAALQNIQQFSGGIKFGPNVAFTATAVMDTAQNAAGMAGVLQFAANLAQAQAAQNPQAAGVLKALAISSQGTTVNLALSLPMEKVRQMLEPPKDAATRASRPAQDAAPRPAQKKK